MANEVEKICLQKMWCRIHRDPGRKGTLHCCGQPMEIKKK